MLHEEKIPWEKVLISGWILDPDRKKMSKSKGNVETPESWMDKYSADAVRYWSAKAKLGIDTTFDPNVMKIGQRLVTKIFNVAKFVYYQPAYDVPVSTEIDKGFIYELKELVQDVTESFNNYDHSQALALTESFFWKNYTDTYVELVKKRSFDEDFENMAEQGSAVVALRKGLSVLLRLFAPFLPYITEEVWSWIQVEESDKSSIHITQWPTMEEFDVIDRPQYDSSFETTISCLESVHKFKAKNNASVGAAMYNLEIKSSKETIKVLELCKDDLQKATKAEVIVLKEQEENSSEKFEISGRMIPKEK